MFADLHSGNGGGDGLEFAADFGGCIGFGVEAVVLPESSGEEDIDAGFEGLCGSGVTGGGHGFEAGEVIHAESKEANAASLHSGAAGNSRVTQRRAACEHMHP